MQRLVLVVVTMVALGIVYTDRTLAHVSKESGHLGSYLFRAPNSGRADPTSFVFTWGDENQTINHFYDYHFAWAHVGGGQLVYGSHGEWTGPYAQRGTADCADCARDHIRFYDEVASNGTRRYDPNHGYYTPAHIHHDLYQCGGHIGAYFDEKRFMVRNHYSAGGHNVSNLFWSNTGQAWDSCNGVWRGGNGYVTYIDNLVR